VQLLEFANDYPTPTINTKVCCGVRIISKATFDSLSISQWVAEYLARAIQLRSILATLLSPTQQLPSLLPNVANY
jgi:hypothetical protein